MAQKMAMIHCMHACICAHGVANVLFDLEETEAFCKLHALTSLEHWSSSMGNICIHAYQ